MIPSKSKGWMVNFSMRRVEPAEAEESPFNTPHYGKYRSPRRTYMLYTDMVFGSELEALHSLHSRMVKRRDRMALELARYSKALDSVAGAMRVAQHRSPGETIVQSWLT